MMIGPIEHWGLNRSGKTELNAIFAWTAYKEGKTVYANCPRDYKGHFHCIINFPHQHGTPAELYYQDPYDCYVMTDEGATQLDSHRASTQDILDSGLFGLQVSKRGISWHYDTVRHKNIAPMVRLNPFYYIKTVRIPTDIMKPLMSIKVTVAPRDSLKHSTFYIMQPWQFFPLFNSITMVHPYKKPDIQSIHKQLVAP